MIKIDKRYYIEDNKLYHNCSLWDFVKSALFLEFYNWRQVSNRVMMLPDVNIYMWFFGCMRCGSELPSIIHNKVKFVNEEIKFR